MELKVQALKRKVTSRKGCITRELNLCDKVIANISGENLPYLQTCVNKAFGYFDFVKKISAEISDIYIELKKTDASYDNESSFDAYTNATEARLQNVTTVISDFKAHTETKPDGKTSMDDANSKQNDQPDQDVNEAASTSICDDISKWWRHGLNKNDQPMKSNKSDVSTTSNGTTLESENTHQKIMSLTQTDQDVKEAATKICSNEIESTFVLKISDQMEFNISEMNDDVYTTSTGTAFVSQNTSKDVMSLTKPIQDANAEATNLFRRYESNPKLNDQPMKNNTYETTAALLIPENTTNHKFSNDGRIQMAFNGNSYQNANITKGPLQSSDTSDDSEKGPIRRGKQKGKTNPPINMDTDSSKSTIKGNLKEHDSFRDDEIMDTENKTKLVSEWQIGKLCSRGDYIKPQHQLPEGFNDQDVFMLSKTLSPFLLLPKEGDTVEFILCNRNKFPIAIRVRVVEYTLRSMEVLLEYFDKYRKMLHSPSCSDALVSTLQTKSLWQYLGSVQYKNADETISYMFGLLDFLNDVLKIGKQYSNLMTDTMKEVLGGCLFQNTGDLTFPVLISKKDIGLKQQNLFEFCLNVVESLPKLSRCILPIVRALSEKDPSIDKQQFLFRILNQALSNTNLDEPDIEKWDSMPMVLTKEELKSGLVRTDKHISSVKLGRPYDSSEDYMDTYFRLLRAEAFSSLQVGINKLKSNQLDHRDMNVYYNVHLVGYEVTDSSFNLAIEFQTAKPVGRWEASQKLMFGNLLCLSPNRKFDDVIWATVSNRDEKLLNKSQVIMIDLIFNTKSTSQMMAMLLANVGNTVMVESPTYFRSLGPILSSLKAFDIQNFPFYKEIVETEYQKKKPSYISSSNPSATATDHIITSNHGIILEESQTDAIKEAMLNNLAIIQGPPGCGKTLVGSRIVQLILGLEPKIKKPILLLTYKNHALDEFLKHMLSFVDKDEIVRIGGGSKEPELEECNMNKIIRNDRRRIVRMIYDEIRCIKNKIQELKTQINDLSCEINKSCCLTETSLIEILSDEQVTSLLVKAGGNNRDLRYWLSMNIAESYSWIVGQIDPISREFGSLKNFILLGENRSRIQWIFKQVLQLWIPDITELQKMQIFQEQFIDGMRHAESDDTRDAKYDQRKNDDDSDEQAVKEIHESRMAPLKGGKQTNEVIFFEADNNRQGILFKLSDFPNGMEYSSAIKGVKSLWQLTNIERMQFIYSHLKERNLKVFDEFDEVHSELQKAQNRKRELEVQQKVCVLRQRKIIGMTITGASIYHDIIHGISPNIVIVEEAAEILEPSLLAALTPDIEHLILIGDHQQLRPHVDTYELRRDHYFDVSLMERLIESGFPYQTLRTQNRMRPEFAELLHDIYPTLQNNMELVCKNKPLSCLEKSMFFWSHQEQEILDRSYTNPKEADRVVSLVLYLLMCGCQTSEITVLSAYQRQTKIIRDRLKHEKLKRPELYNSDEGSSFIQVQTIDMFQGDENKYVIVSLVRSNENGQIGFLKEMSRRCVAQSRAKCGLYFVGNTQTLYNARRSPWRYLIDNMTTKGCVGNEIVLQCWKHKETSKVQISNHGDLMQIVDNPTKLCKNICGDQLPCDIPGHNCRKNCIPWHSHDKCQKFVKDIFPECKHATMRKCFQSIESLNCKTIVNFVAHCGHLDTKKCCQDENEQSIARRRCNATVTFSRTRCGHPDEKKCWQDENDISCELPCVKKMKCDIHACQKKCGAKHNHNKCIEKVGFSFRNCKHECQRCCYQQIESIKCQSEVNVTLTKCGHKIAKKCYQGYDQISCHRCQTIMTRGHHLGKSNDRFKGRSRGRPQRPRNYNSATYKVSNGKKSRSRNRNREYPREIDRGYSPEYPRHSSTNTDYEHGTDRYRRTPITSRGNISRSHTEDDNHFDTFRQINDLVSEGIEMERDSRHIEKVDKEEFPHYRNQEALMPAAYRSRSRSRNRENPEQSQTDRYKRTPRPSRSNRS